MILETLCAEEEDESYWKALAEERQSALNTTLEENQDLTELIQTKTEEVKVLENEKEELIQEEFSTELFYVSIKMRGWLVPPTHHTVIVLEFAD